MIVSVIICTYSMSRFSDLMEAVQSLLKQTYQPMEIIVVVDHNAELYEKLKPILAKKIRLLHNQDVKGLSGSRNYGIDAASGEIIVFFDDDAVASRDWIEQIIKPYHESKVVAVGGLTLPRWEDKKPYWFPPEFYWVLGCTYKGYVEEMAVVRSVIGVNCSFRRSCIKQVGKFLPCIGRIGEKMLTGEETEYCMRIQKMMPDHKILFYPEAVVYHNVPKQRTTLKYFIKRTYGSGFSLAIIHKLLPGKEIKTEQSFLKHLLLNFVPRMLKVFFRHPFSAVGQLAVVFLGVFFTGMGCIVGTSKKIVKE